MKENNVFARFIINYSQATTSSAIPIGSLVESCTLVLYHLQRLAIILASSDLNLIPRVKLYGAFGHIIRVFEVGFWTEVTPIPYEGFVLIFFIIITLQLILYVIFLVLALKKKTISKYVEISMAYSTLIFNRYLFYIPIYESSYYVIFNLRAKTPFFALAIFNLVMITVFKIVIIIISHRSTYSRPKFLAEYQNRETIDMIGFLIMVACLMSNYQTGSMIPIYLMLSLSCLQLAISLIHPRYLIPALNNIDLFSHSFCLGFSLVLILQSTSYKGLGTEFPFLIVTSLLYGLMKNIDHWRRRTILSLFERDSSLRSRIIYLPFIYEEYMQASKNDEIIRILYPLLARRNNTYDETPIFALEDFSLEAVPLKYKANKVFVSFISNTYDEYFNDTDENRSGVQSLMLTYLFFTRFVLKDHLKVLVLIHDFRRKLKAKGLTFGWNISIQVARLERMCTDEYLILKTETALDTSRVFKMLKQTEELITNMNAWTHDKISFFENLKTPTVNLQKLREKASKLLKDSKAILNCVEHQKELIQFSKVKNSVKYFIEEVLQENDALSLSLKTMFKETARASKLSLEDLDTFKIIEKLQNNDKNPILLFSAEGFSGTIGKITHSTEYLTQRLGYSQAEVKNLTWRDILVGMNETLQETDRNDTISDSKKKKLARSVHQAILRCRNGDFVVIKHMTHLDVIHKIPCIVLIGQEEPSSQQNFILCKKDGLIVGLSKSLTEAIPEIAKLKGRKFHDLFIVDNPTDFNFEGQDLNSTRARGMLRFDLLSSPGLFNLEEFDFLIKRFNNSDLSKDCYDLVYIYSKKKAAWMQQNRIRSAETLNSGPPMKFAPVSSQQQDLINVETKADALADEEAKTTEMMSPLRNKLSEGATKIECLLLHHPKEQELDSAFKRQISYRNKLGLNSKDVKRDSPKRLLNSDNFLANNSSSKNNETDEQELEHEKHNLKLINEQRESSYPSGSVHGGSNRKRAVDYIKQTLKRPVLPIAVRFILLLQIILCIGMLVYFIADYFDLSARYITLSELSGLTSFPLQLLWNIYNFLQTEELLETTLQQLWSPFNRLTWLEVLPSSIGTSYQSFEAQYDEFVLQVNPQSRYPDFSYSIYTMNLSLPDSPYLNREVSFQEALDVLRGYMYLMVIASENGSYIDYSATNFLSTQCLAYDKMFSNLSDDLFSRLTGQFDALLLSLQLRVLVGATVALVIGISLTYIFWRLYTHSLQLLSLMITISESEQLEEIIRLQKSAAILSGGSENNSLGRQPLLQVEKKEAKKKYSQARKYTPPNKNVFVKLLFILSLMGLFLILPIVGYFEKQAPVASCIPLLAQYEMFAENAEISIAIATHVLHVVSLAYEENTAQSLSFLNQTQVYFDDSKDLYLELATFVDNEEALVQNSYMSSNLTQNLDSLRNASWCYPAAGGIPDVAEICINLTNGIAANGIAPEYEKNIEWVGDFRDQLAASNSRELAVNITLDETFNDLSNELYYVSADLSYLIPVYISNFQDIASTANSSLLTLLIVSLAYYVLLLMFVLLPLFSWTRKQYTEVREIYTLLPTRSLLSNPYIKNMLKRKDHW